MSSSLYVDTLTLKVTSFAGRAFQELNKDKLSNKVGSQTDGTAILLRGDALYHSPYTQKFPAEDTESQELLRDLSRYQPWHTVVLDFQTSDVTLRSVVEDSQYMVLCYSNRSRWMKGVDCFWIIVCVFSKQIPHSPHSGLIDTTQSDPKPFWPFFLTIIYFCFLGDFLEICILPLLTPFEWLVQCVHHWHLILSLPSRLSIHQLSREVISIYKIACHLCSWLATIVKFIFIHRLNIF